MRAALRAARRGVSESLQAVQTNGGPRPGRASVTQHTLYVLDEPTVSLHMADVEKLIRVVLAASPDAFLKAGARGHTARALREFMRGRAA